MATNELIISRHNRHCLQCRSIAHNGTMLYAGQEIELLNLKICTNVDSR